jgi:hypothetical protein
MFRRIRYKQVLLGGVAALALAAPSSALAGSSPLLAQSQALNARYGNAVTALSSKEFIDLYKDGGSKMSPHALNALVTEGQALDARGIPSSPTITIDNPGFQWGDFGLGAAVAAAAMILLALSMRFVNRREQQGRPSTASR